MTLLYSVQYGFWGRGPDSTHVLGGFFLIFFRVGTENGPIRQNNTIRNNIRTLFSNFYHLHPKNCDLWVEYRGGVSSLGSVVPPYGFSDWLFRGTREPDSYGVEGQR